MAFCALPTPRRGLGLRRQLTGIQEVRAALHSEHPPRLLLVLRDLREAGALALCEEASQRGVSVERVSANDLRRMARVRPAPPLLALCGPDPAPTFGELVNREGALWLLCGVTYAGNAGFAIRSAEVSGAAGIVLDVAFTPAERNRALRFSMHAERFFPVQWRPGAEVVAAARTAGRRVIAIEDVGERAPWQEDLRGSPLFVIGGERDGIDANLLARCDSIVRVPMRGFVPAYNLQAAMAAVVGEQLRQES